MLKGLKSLRENTILTSFCGEAHLLPSESKSRPCRDKHSFFMEEVKGRSLPGQGSATEL